MALNNNGTFSLLDLILGRGGNISPDDHSGAVFLEQSGRTNAGERVTVENLLEEPTVLSCVNAIVQGVTQIPIQVRRDAGDGVMEVVRGHALTKLLKRPNSFQTASEFKSSIITTILVHGNAFIRIMRNNGKPVQLVPMDPSDITIGSNNMGIPVYTHEAYGVVDIKDIIHIRDIQTFNPLGQSRLLLAAEVIGAKMAADRLMSETFKNGVSMNYVVNTEGTLDVDAKKNLIEGLKKSFGAGGSGRGSIAIIENGGMNAIKGSTPADADLRELRAMLIREIAAVMRVPEMLAGGTGDQKYNNVRQQWAAFHRDTLQPLVTNIEEAFTLKLLGEGEYLHFDIAELLKGDVEITARIAQANVSNGIWTPNEARSSIGTPPHDSEEADQLIKPNSSTNENIEGGGDSVGTDPANPADATGGEDGPQGGDND